MKIEITSPGFGINQVGVECLLSSVKKNVDRQIDRKVLDI